MVGLRAKVLGRMGWTTSPYLRAGALSCPSLAIYGPGLYGAPEVVGGIWILLVTWAALLAGRHPRALNYFGVVVGVAGVLTVVPALEVLGIGFRLGEIVWFVWVGIVMFRGSRSAAARKLHAFFAVRFGMRVATTQDLTPTRGEA
jgi:hypothetical protein